MYGVPLPPQATAPGQTPSQGVATTAAAPQWGGQGYQNQYLQQRQQMQQQLASLQRPNAPMPPQPNQRPPGMAQGGMMTMPPQAMMPPRQGALNYASGGPTGMQTVEQEPLSSQGNPQGRALVAQAPHAASPLWQNGVPTGALQPFDYGQVMNNQPTAAQIPDLMRQRGIFTADSTPQYLSVGNTGTPRTVINRLGPQGQPTPQYTQPAPTPPPAPTHAADDISQQIAAVLQDNRASEANNYAEGGDIDFTGGGQPIDYNAGRKRDTVPALVEHGEFVMTRKAVRGIGNGSIENGGKIMGALMRHFESYDK